MGFDIAFSTVLTTLLYILPGYLVSKAGKVRPEHLSGLSGLMIYGCSPCMIASTIFMLEFSAETLKGMALFFFFTLLLQGAFMAILYYFLHRKYDDAKYRIFTLGSVLGNVGFFGLPIVKALLPGHPEAASYSAVFMISMNVFVFTMGIFCLTRDAKYITLNQAFNNPSTYAFLVGLVLFLLHGSEWMPALVTNAVQVIGNMTTPLCMLILGVRLSAVHLPDLLKRPIVYLVCIMKLLVFPLVSYAIVSLFPFLDHTFRCSILILCGTPCAAIVLSMAEMYEAEQELSANCVLLTTLLCFLTLPVLTLFA